jgi:hypothetical protein
MHARRVRLWLNTGSSSARGLVMPNVEPNRLPATALVRLIEGGELTAEAVIRKRCWREPASLAAQNETHC